LRTSLPKETLILICGIGSIGERHIGNLLNLGYENLILFRTRSQPFRTIKRAFPTYTDLNEALQQEPKIVFITNPTSLHMPTAIACAKASCHLFIEKPLSNELDRVGTLADIIYGTEKKVMVGYMMRFHPCLQRAKIWIEEGRIGTAVFARSQWGEFLPDWHPWEDYRDSYAASRVMGGGPALTLSHDIDSLVWLFGPPSEALGMTNNFSNLEIETEPVADILIRFQSGITANVHLDFIQKPPSRTLEIVGTEGKICFDYYLNIVQLWSAKTGEKIDEFAVSSAFDRNQLFLDEVGYFFDCIVNDRKPAPGIEEALESVKVALNVFLAVS